MTRLLLDTHAALFWWAGSAELSRAACAAVMDEASDVFVSAASAWEIATKFRLGKLAFAGDPGLHFPRLMARDEFAHLAVGAGHALSAGLLPGEHRDPFDRLIAAQAIAEQLTVVTRDPEIAAFGCTVLW